MPDQVLTIKEVAAQLDLGQWRMKRTELDQWLDAQPRGRVDEREHDGQA